MEEPCLPDSAWFRSFRRRLVPWYTRNARDLPWRRCSDPYRVWLSEIMLQQTQVATVIPYFERFLQHLPSIAALGAADEQHVLRLWEGLGYYRRARQLHQAARQIVAEHGGQFPREADTVRRLPGIGRYTAGAILSIAFDQRQPILEANTLRLFSRLMAYRGQPAASEGARLLWDFAEAALPRSEPGRFNQALMELGSTICTPREPRCSQCPVEALCRARAQGIQAEIPPPKKRPAFEERHEAAVIVRRRDRFLMVRCGEGRRWAGLWDFPRVHVPRSRADDVVEFLRKKLRDEWGVVAELGQRLTRLRHGVTRFRITLDCYQARHRSGPPKPDPARWRWLRPADLETLPLSTTGRKLSRLITEE